MKKATTVAQLEAEQARDCVESYRAFYCAHHTEIEAGRAQIRREQSLANRAKRWAVRFLVLASVFVVSTVPAQAAWVWLNPFGVWGAWVPNIPIGWWP